MPVPALARAVVLHGMGKTVQVEDLGNRTYQFVLDLYGGPSPFSEAMKKLYGQLDSDATI